MKATLPLSILLCMSLAACKDDTPDSMVYYPVNVSFVPATAKVNKADTDFRNECIKWSDKTIIVNSADELPDDPLGFNDAYRKINFTNQTLLIHYQMHHWDIVSYTDQYYKNNVENTLNWVICLGINGKTEIEMDWAHFTRYAILVRKMPKDTDLTVWYNYQDYNWDWDN